jgi:fused signal recognition particle receptor
VIEIWVFIIVLLAFVAIGLYLATRGRGTKAPPAADTRPAPPVAPPTAPGVPPTTIEQAPAPPPAAEPEKRAAPTGLAGRIRALFPGGGATEETWKGLEEALIRADVGPRAAADVVARVRDRYQPSMDPTDVVVDAIAGEFAGDPPWEVPPGPDGAPSIVMVVGVNGTGKTTTIGKIAARLRTEGRSVGMAASDTFRAAAGEQLEVWAGRTGATVVSQERGADPGAVAFDAVKAAEARHVDVLIVDTAGRLHTRTPLMEELKKVRRVIEKAAGRPPDEVLLVVDATTGQNGIRQAESFTEAVDVSGVVLTKLDGTARGGIVLAVRTELGLPVVLVGTGEGANDLAPFDPVAFARGLVS